MPLGSAYALNSKPIDAEIDAIVRGPTCGRFLMKRLAPWRGPGKRKTCSASVSDDASQDMHRY